MILKFTIPTTKEKMPGLNEYLAAERVKFRTRNGAFMTKGAVMKKNWQKYISAYIRKDLKRQKITKPFIVHYTYYEKDRRRDVGNIHATCQKFTEDALQDCGTIPNDSQAWIKGFTAEFFVDQKNPRVEIVLEELE